MICPVVVNEMSPEAKPEIRLQIGHVLFIDIVGYSKKHLVVMPESYPCYPCNPRFIIED